MAAPIVVSKSPAEVFAETFDLSSVLISGTEITGAVIGLITPSGELTIDNVIVTSPDVQMRFSAGVDGVTYGARLDINDSIGRTLSVTIAILVSSQIGNAFVIKNPEGVQTLVDTIEAGNVAVGNALFTFPTGTNISGGFITWELLDVDGIVYANGNAFEYRITDTALSTKAEGRAIITIPSDVPINIQGNKYQVRWTLTLPDSKGTFFAYENVSVVAPFTVPHGVEDNVEIQGDIAKLTIVLPKFFDHVGAELYTIRNSEKLENFFETQEKFKTADGYYMVLRLATETLPVLLDHYVVVWKYWNDVKPDEVFRQTGRLFVTNASMLSAVDDMRSFIQRSDATLAHKHDMLFTIPNLMTFLRRGKDAFNGAHGMLTSFDMTDATSSIRQFWLWCSEIEALRAQFLAEGEKAFNFSGQAISLDVDRTQYYDSLANTLQQRLDAELKAFKQNLIKKGIISGTGNIDSIGIRQGAIGAIGINISPASNFSRFMGKLGTGAVVTSK